MSVPNETQIIPSEVDHVGEVDQSYKSDEEPTNRKADYIGIAILFFINLLNYIDRFTIAGVLGDVEKSFKVKDNMTGLIQTSFILSYMIFSPVFGFLGDRFSRKYIIIGGVSLWSLLTLSSSFVSDSNFYLFLFLRACVGIGEASYSTVAPTIIADIFVGDMRTKVMSIFYFAIPVGSGLGYVLGVVVTNITGEWRWTLRMTPILGLILIILLLMLVRDPPRGRAEGGTHLHVTSWGTDLKRLTFNRSFMTITFGFTAVAFVTGALSWWAVIFINSSIDSRFNDKDASDPYNVGIWFGVTTCLAGLIGVVVGSEMARRLRPRTLRSDPLVCAFGMILSAPFLLGALIACRDYFYATFILIFIGETFLCLNWSLVADMTMSVVIPTRRSSASAYQMVISHALGDAGSPYIIGQISASLQRHRENSLATTFLTRQYALFSTPFICVLGGGFFLMCSLFIAKDKYKVHSIVHESRDHYHAVGSSYEPIEETLSDGPSGIA